MRLLPALLLGSLALSACAGGPPADPPEGWTAASTTRWYTAGADTSVAFRDLSTLEAMGVARDDDAEIVRWTQEKLTDLYRTSPETVDSVFAADYVERVRTGASGPEAEEQVKQIATEFYQRYNPSSYQAPGPLALPADLADAKGAIATQVYVSADGQPLAVMLVEGTGTALDQVMMRHAIDGTFTDAWVRKTAGRSAGTPIPTWVRITSNYDR